ncbi:MAG: Sinorhizobium phage phiM12 [Candidatus Parcubacteria bacterium]
MTVHFVYMWFDKNRKMFYVGQHSGSFDDEYTSSSRWLSGEIRFRPNDFKRRIIKTFSCKNEAQIYEGYLLTLIKSHEFGKKYYNIKSGKPKGTKPWNAGKKDPYKQSTLDKMSKAKIGKPSNNQYTKLKADCLVDKEQSANPHSITA